MLLPLYPLLLGAERLVDDPPERDEPEGAVRYDDPVDVGRVERDRTDVLLVEVLRVLELTGVALRLRDRNSEPLIVRTRAVRLIVVCPSVVFDAGAEALRRIATGCPGSRSCRTVVRLVEFVVGRLLEVRRVLRPLVDDEVVGVPLRTVVLRVSVRRALRSMVPVVPRVAVVFRVGTSFMDAVRRPTRVTVPVSVVRFVAPFVPAREIAPVATPHMRSVRRPADRS